MVKSGWDQTRAKEARSSLHYPGRKWGLNMRKSRPLLLVEDDNVDTLTIEHALKDLNVTNPLVHSGNGEQALEYLKTDGNKKPCVILLDLNMPKVNGIEFLKAIKADKELKKIPVIVLTTSGEERNIVKSFELGAAGYMVKPVDYKKFVEAIRIIHLYWTLNELPIRG